MENWRHVSHDLFSDNYFVSDMGNIISVGYDKLNKQGFRVTKPARLLKLLSTDGRYLYVRLAIDGHQQSIKVHRLVASAFIPNPNNKPSVNHKDGNKHNNSVSNLEWVTHSENVQHSFDILGKVGPNKKPVNQYTVTGEFIAKWPSITEAAKASKMRHVSILKHLSGIVKTPKKYVWELA